MPVRRRRRPGSDRLYVSTDSGLPLGHLDLITRAAHDVPSGWRDQFLDEANAWLWSNNMPTIGGPDPDDAEAPVLEAGVEPPEGGWDAGWEDLAVHLPGHGLADEAARARTESGPDADRPTRLRSDGRQTVAEAMVKLTRARAVLRRGGGPRWRVLHAVPMAFEGREIVLDHVVIGPAGVFVLEVQNHPGGRAVVGPESLEIDQVKMDLGRRRRIGDEAARRLSAGLARAAGAMETLNPPSVTPVVAVVGAVVVGGDRPRGVLVSRVGHLPRLLQAFGTTLVDEGVAQTYEVARRSTTWTP
jgi:hypothetical protein